MSFFSCGRLLANVLSILPKALRALSQLPDLNAVSNSEISSKIKANWGGGDVRRAWVEAAVKATNRAITKEIAELKLQFMGHVDDMNKNSSESSPAIVKKYN